MGIESEIRELYSSIDVFMRESRFEECNDLLRSVEVPSAPTPILVGYLRILYPARDKVPYWSEFLANVREELAQRNEDAEKILQGL
ncbi:MAG: hypothetical protein Q8R53_04290 [Nanoarchaeota archaeon]|nr:hypothetical protein [Nanoarchaeota archaeon]